VKGMQTLDASRPEDVYLHLDEIIEQAEDVVHCYSRLPMRQLLRYVSANSAEMWWLSEHNTPRAIPPHPNEVFSHIKSSTRVDSSLVVLEGLDWLVRRTNETTVLEMLQSLDGLSRERDFRVVLAGDSLSLNPTFWARICSLAPKIPVSTNPVEVDDLPHDFEEAPIPHTPIEEAESSPDDTVLVHLVKLPQAGFTHAVLARRMLQWKRMGFDLAALEPAMASNDMGKAHTIYAGVEGDIIMAIDAIRLMEQRNQDLTVTERERFNYRFMSLNEVAEGYEELLAALSSR
jgi:DNA-binding transcriptional ArsR family regulator